MTRRDHQFVIVELFISTSTYPYVVQRTSSLYSVGHSWGDYIYSPPTRYTVLLPFAISKISTELSVLDVLRFCPILDPLTIGVRVTIMCQYVTTHKRVSLAFEIVYYSTV